MHIALTHAVSTNIDKCELSFIKREKIDFKRAVAQHDSYCNMLREAGIYVIELHVNSDYPDSTFIEDTAVVVDELAIMAHMGAETRRGEVAGVESELKRYRKIVHISHPATLDGGDVLQVGQ